MDQQLATEMFRRNSPRIWLVGKVYPLLPTFMEQMKEVNSVCRDGGESPARSQVWGRRRSMAESRNFVVSGNRHGKHLERAVPVPLPMPGCFFCFGLFHRCRVLCSLLQRFCI